MRKIAFCLFMMLGITTAFGQAQTGLYPFGSFDTPGFDTIDRGSLNVHFTIPVVNKQGRGLGFQYQLAYDSLVWSPVSSGGTQTWTPAPSWGLTGQITGLNEGYQGYLSYFSNLQKCYQQGGGFTWTPVNSHYAYHDSFGVSHPFTYTYNACTGVSSGGGASADGSGYSFSGGYVTAADGKQINAPIYNPNSNGTITQTSSGSLTDTNGNYISNNGNGTFTDTLGKTVLTISGSGTPSSPKVFAYSTPSGTAQVTVTYTSYTVRTNFGCASTDYNLPQDLPSTITLADGSVYTLGYEATPGYSGDVTGRLASITLPQGGVITYQYTGANNGIVCSDGSTAGLTRTGGVGRTYVRSSITSASSHTDITDGLNNDLGFDFAISGSPEAFYETNRNVHQGNSSGPILLSRQTCYNGSSNPCTTTAVTAQVTQVDTYETLNGIEQHGSTFTYNTVGQLTSQTDYDFTSSTTSHGPPLRQETWTYVGSGAASLLQSDSVLDGSNNQIGYTTYAYDETAGTGHAALVATSGLPNHNPVSGGRGNLTSVNQYPGYRLSALYTGSAYEDTGNPLNVTSPNGVSSYAYDSATHAFTVTATPPTPSSGVSLPTSATYDPSSSLPLTATDPNSQVVTYKSYDPLFRPTEIDYPDGGKMIASYTPTSTGMYRYMTASTHTNTQTSLESFGRLNWVAVQNATGGYYWNNYCYDGNGNLSYAAYRFTSGTITCSGAGDSYTYDALGRVLKVTHSDQSTVNYTYDGRATQVVDENGVTRITQVDGLGRPVKVCEVYGSMVYGVSPASCGLDISATGFLTQYAYSTDTANANALQTKVTQGSGSGLQTRTFETDWLGRTTEVIQPESGTTTYGYAYSTTAGYGLTVTRVRPQANQTGAATTTTTTQYDSVGRVVSVSYSDGTPSKGFAYDTNIYWAQVGTNLKGRLAVTGGGSGATWNGSSIGYDAMGRVINIWQCGPATCGTGYQAARPLSFAYDWAGNLIQESDGASGTIAYGRSIAGEVTSITNQTYQNAPYNPPNLVSNVVNGPDGPVSYTLGNGLNVYRSYDTLGRLYGQWVCNGPANPTCSGGTQI